MTQGCLLGQSFTWQISSDGWGSKIITQRKSHSRNVQTVPPLVLTVDVYHHLKSSQSQQVSLYSANRLYVRSNVTKKSGRSKWSPLVCGARIVWRGRSRVWGFAPWRCSPPALLVDRHARGRSWCCRSQPWPERRGRSSEPQRDVKGLECTPQYYSDTAVGAGGVMMMMMIISVYGIMQTLIYTQPCKEPFFTSLAFMFVVVIIF